MSVNLSLNHSLRNQGNDRAEIICLLDGEKQMLAVLVRRVVTFDALLFQLDHDTFYF